MSRLRRIWRHLNTGTSAMRHAFPKTTRLAIEQAIKAAERAGATDIRFAVEDSLPFLALHRGLTPRARAEQVFSELRVWNTQHHTGVLVYVLLADRSVEIVADRGVGGGRIPTDEWRRCCREMEVFFAKGDFHAGSIAGVGAVAAVLARFPGPHSGNELPDAPAIL